MLCYIYYDCVLLPSIIIVLAVVVSVDYRSGAGGGKVIVDFPREVGGIEHTLNIYRKAFVMRYCYIACLFKRNIMG